MQEHIFIVRANFMFWKLFALWNDGNESRGYKIYRIVFHWFFTVLYFGSIIIGSLAVSTVDDFFTQTLYMALTEMAMYIKIMIIFNNFTTVKRLHNIALSPEFEPQSVEEAVCSRRILGRVNFYYLGFVVFAIIGILSHLTYVYDGKYKLPFFPWVIGISYGRHLPYNHAILCYYQITGMAIHAILNAAVDCQIGYLLAVASNQLDFLSWRFLEMRCPNDMKTGTSEIKRLYRNHFEHYNKINQFVKDVERAYSIPVFSQFCASGITICSIAYRLSLVNFAKEFTAAIPLVMYLFSMTVQIFLPCYLGNELTFKSERLHRAVYFSEWYRMDIRNQKDIKMFMVRSVRSATLKAGGYFGYNLGAFTSTLNMAYSLFCVLQRRAQAERNN